MKNEQNQMAHKAEEMNDQLSYLDSNISVLQ